MTKNNLVQVWGSRRWNLDLVHECVNGGPSLHDQDDIPLQSINVWSSSVLWCLLVHKVQFLIFMLERSNNSKKYIFLSFFLYDCNKPGLQPQFPMHCIYIKDKLTSSGLTEYWMGVCVPCFLLGQKDGDFCFDQHQSQWEHF